MRRWAVVAICVLSVSAAGCGDRSEPSCDRSCLVAIADRYLAALLSHDPAAVPLAKGLLFIENITAMKPGQGLWVTAAGEPPTFRIHVPDPAAGVVGMMAVIRRRTDQGVAPAILAVRLAV